MCPQLVWSSALKLNVNGAFFIQGLSIRRLKKPTANKNNNNNKERRHRGRGKVASEGFRAEQ